MSRSSQENSLALLNLPRRTQLEVPVSAPGARGWALSPALTVVKALMVPMAHVALVGLVLDP